MTPPIFPSQQDFADRGLRDFEVDTPPTTSGPSLVSGWANFDPVSEHSVLGPVTPGERVYVRWTAVGDAVNSERFIRNAQLIAIDCMMTHSADSGSGSSSYVSAIHTPSEDPSTVEDVQRALAPPGRSGTDSEILAFWTGADGLWLITRADSEDVMGLVQYWDAVFPFPALLRDKSGRIPTASDSPVLTRHMARAFLLLVQLVHCFECWSDKWLSLVGGRPRDFVVQPDFPHHVLSPHLDNVRSLPGFDMSSRIASTVLEKWSLFKDFRKTSQSLQKPFKDDFMHDRLSYLSPETVINRRPSASSDIYSFGAIVYELLTGQAPGTIDTGGLGDQDNHMVVEIQQHLVSVIPAPSTSLQLNVTPEMAASSTGTILRLLDGIVSKCLRKDPQDRYGSLESLIHDLQIIAEACVSNSLETVILGESDRFASFRQPLRPVKLDEQLLVLDNAVAKLSEPSFQHRSRRVINIWGLTGTGKSKLLSYWTAQLANRSSDGQRFLVAQAQIEKNMPGPVSTFVQIFEGIIQLVLLDTSLDGARAWNTAIRKTLGSFYPTFLSLLSKASQRLITLGQEAPQGGLIDWSSFLAVFKLWSKHLLQLFATKERPLILVIDDLQWMPSTELEVWKAIVDGEGALEHVLLVSAYQTTAKEGPPVETLLSDSCDSVETTLLNKEGVETMITSCFNAPIDRLDALSRLILTETAGVPLHVSSLLQNLVQENILSFDFVSCIWRFDLVKVQKQLTSKGLDAYLHWIQHALDDEGKKCITALSLLPLLGADNRLLAEFVELDEANVQRLVKGAASVGVVRINNRGQIKMTHQLQRDIAYGLHSSDELAKMHLRASKFLQQPRFKDDYAYESALHILKSGSLGVELQPSSGLVSLLLDGITQANRSSAFRASKALSESVRELVDRAGGYPQWMNLHRPLYLRYIQQNAEISSALGDFDDSFREIAEILPLCDAAHDRLRVKTIQIRLMIHTTRFKDAFSLFYQLLNEFGYNPQNPSSLELWEPKDMDDIARLRRQLIASQPIEGDTTIPSMICSLIASLTHVVYVLKPGARQEVYRLAISIVASLDTPNEATIYLLASFGVTCSSIKIKEGLNELCRYLVSIWPTSHWTAVSLTTIATQTHRFRPLSFVAEETSLAYQGAMATAQYEIAAYTQSINSATLDIGGIPDAMEQHIERYNELREFVKAPHTILVKLPLQYWLAAGSRPALDVKPWIFTADGLVSEIDLQSTQKSTALPLHRAIYFFYQLRLAILFNADHEEQLAIAKDGEEVADSFRELVFWPEWRFLTALVDLSVSEKQTHLESAIAALTEAGGECLDWVLRRRILQALSDVYRNDSLKLKEMDSLVSELDGLEQHLLSGLLTFQVAQFIVQRFENEKLAWGYFGAASTSFSLARHIGVCHILADRYSACPRPAASSGFYLGQAKARLERMVVPSTRTLLDDDPTSSMSGRSFTANETFSAGNQIGTLTIVRASLAVASEREPGRLLCLLLKLICEFAHGDYAAAAFGGHHDSTSLRWAAAGQYGAFESMDVGFEHPAAATIGPTTVALRVARTSIPILHPDALSGAPSDLFYGHRTPSMLACQPIFYRNEPIGVLLVSNKKLKNDTLDTEAGRGVIATLATMTAAAYQGS